MKTNEYDINVYVVDGVVYLSAYEYTYSDAPQPEPNGTNTANFITLELPMDTGDADEIAYLLSDENWQGQDWQDYDSPWESKAWLSYAPARIAEWSDGLPEYTPTVQHQWEEARFDLRYGESRQVKCLNCDATYEQKRLSWDELRGIGLGASV